jgi:kynureninase
LSTPLTADEVAAWRTRFPILSRRTYLANHSLGAMPGSVPAALADFTSDWAGQGVESWPGWLAEVRDVADLLGSLIGAPPGTVVLHQNVATLTALFLSALPREGGRRRVVLAADEWPGHRYLAAEEQRLGLEPVVVPATDGVDALLEAVDERTALVLTSHVRFRDARILDLEAVVARAHAVGAQVLADGYHAAGMLPVDVRAVGVDAYVGGSVKWLCGGPGVGWLYVRPAARAAMRPAMVGWLGHARPFDFASDWEAAEGAFGWLGGTPSVPAVFGAREGYRILSEVGPDRVRATTAALTARLVQGAQERGLGVNTPLDPASRAGTVTLDVGPDPASVAERLGAAGIVVDARPGAGIRVGAHFFNTMEECEAVLAAVGRERDGARA